jgi:hypothetical protein
MSTPAAAPQAWVTMTVTLTPKAREALKRRCAAERRKQDEILEDALLEYVTRAEQEVKQ